MRSSRHFDCTSLVVGVTASEARQAGPTMSGRLLAGRAASIDRPSMMGGWLARLSQGQRAAQAYYRTWARRLLAPLLVLSLLSACVSQSTGVGSGQTELPSLEIEFTDDPFSSNLSYATGAASLRNTDDYDGSQIWQVIGLVDRVTGERDYAIAWGTVYSGSEWRFFSSARTLGGQSLTMQQVERDVSGCSGRGGCTYSEFYFIAVPEDLLVAARQSGFQFRVSGRPMATANVTIPGPYVTALLDRMSVGQGS